MSISERFRELLRDVAYGARALRRARAYTYLAVITLALGIGATTVVASIVDAVLLRELPYDQPHRIAYLWQSFDREWTRQVNVSMPEFRDYQDRARSLDAIGGFITTGTSLVGTDEPERVQVSLVLGNFFDVFGVRPIHGRFFSAEEAQVPFGVFGLLSERLWRRRFASDPSIVGRPVLMGGRQITIVGIMPESFAFPRGTDVWRPLVQTGDVVTDRSRRFIDVVVRTKAGIAMAAASRDVDAAEQGQPDAGVEATRLVPLRESLVGDVRPAVLIISGAVAFVLLIACANVANLTLVRGASRARELAVRAALGASRRRLVRHLVIESALLCAAGALVGTSLAYWGVRAVALFGPRDVPGLKDVIIDRRVLAGVLGLTIVTALVAGLGPAVLTARSGIASSLTGTRSTGALHAGRLRAVFVVAQIALCITLLVGAALLVKSFTLLRGIDLGFRTEQLLTVKVALPFASYQEAPRRVQFFDELQRRIRALPGVAATGATSILPVSAENSSSSTITDANNGQGRYPEANTRSVTEGYFEALGTRLLDGRLFDARDGSSAQGSQVTVINRSLAERLWPGQTAIGKRLSVHAPPDRPQWRQVVGVVSDIRQGVLGAPPAIEMYEPHPQVGDAAMALVIRTRTDPMGVISAVRGVVRALDPALPVYDVRTMDEHVGESIVTRRFSAVVLSLFSLFALLLAAVGLYGMMSYAVAQRTREFGVRLALGASASDVSRLVVRGAMTIAIVGLGVGTLAALGLAKLLSALLASMLYGVSGFDVATYLVVSSVLLLVALLAGWIPARRATRVDPIRTLRMEG
jgi:putative ABC transport system permease protein